MSLLLASHLLLSCHFARLEEQGCISLFHGVAGTSNWGRLTENSTLSSQGLFSVHG